MPEWKCGGQKAEAIIQHFLSVQSDVVPVAQEGICQCDTSEKDMRQKWGKAADGREMFSPKLDWCKWWPYVTIYFSSGLQILISFLSLSPFYFLYNLTL